MKKLIIFLTAVLSIAIVIFLTTRDDDATRDQTLSKPPSNASGTSSAVENPVESNVTGAVEDSSNVTNRHSPASNIYDYSQGLYVRTQDGTTTLPSVSLITLLDDLANAINSGDNDAAVFLFEANFACAFNNIITERDLDSAIKKINSNTASDDFIKKKSIENKTRTYRFCKGYNARDPIAAENQDLRDLIIRAAREGNIRAKLKFQDFGFPGDPNDVSNLIRNSDLLTEFKNEAIQHLIDARNAGSFQALTLLALNYNQGLIVEQNDVEAYAYFYATQQHQFNIDTDSILSTIGGRLTSDQLPLAQKKGDNYADFCCDQGYP